MPLDTWSKKEKEIARKVFDAAYKREYEAVRQHVIKMTQEKTGLNEIWHVGDFLYKKRKEIDYKYDYRYSQLIRVFGTLVYQKWISTEELMGIDEEKKEKIIGYSTMFDDLDKE